MNCDCITRVDEKLRHAFGTRLATTIVFGAKMETDVTLSVATDAKMPTVLRKEQR